MSGGMVLPKGRRYYRVWVYHDKQKFWIDKSVQGERLYSVDQCNEVLNEVAYL